jgi:hypothetical protein
MDSLERSAGVVEMLDDVSHGYEVERLGGKIRVLDSADEDPVRVHAKSLSGVLGRTGIGFDASYRPPKVSHRLKVDTGSAPDVEEAIRVIGRPEPWIG